MEYEPTIEDYIKYNEEIEREELQELEKKEILIPGVDTEVENIPEQIIQEVIPQPVRRSTRHEAPVDRLEPKMRGKIYETNHSNTKTVEENEKQASTRQKRLQCSSIYLLKHIVLQKESRSLVTKDYTGSRSICPLFLCALLFKGKKKRAR